MEKDILIELDKAMKDRRIRFPYLSELTGIPTARMYKWYQQNTKPKTEDALKIWTWINDKKMDLGRQNLEEADSSYTPDSKQSHQNENTSNNSSLQSLIESNRRLIETQFNYSLAQKQLADAQKILAESHKSVVDNNTTLTTMLGDLRQVTTAYADQEIREAGLAKLDVLQQLLIEVGVGKLWKTKVEGEDRLHKEFSSWARKGSKGHKTAGDSIVHR